MTAAVQPFLTVGPARLHPAAATECILQAARLAEQRALARDLGVEAGTQSKHTIRTLGLRPVMP